MRNNSNQNGWKSLKQNTDMNANNVDKFNKLSKNVSYFFPPGSNQYSLLRKNNMTFTKLFLLTSIRAQKLSSLYPLMWQSNFVEHIIIKFVESWEMTEGSQRTHHSFWNEKLRTQTLHTTRTSGGTTKPPAVAAHTKWIKYKSISLMGPPTLMMLVHGWQN
jgi:hypothetical protein